MNKGDGCIKDPENFGIFCLNKTKCDKCGWNPEVLEKRKAERLKKIEEKEKVQV